MDTVKVGEVIAQQRKKLNMTQSQLAEYLGVSNKAISRWENGITMPDISLLLPLSEILQISLNELLSGKSNVSGYDEILKETVRMSTERISKQKSLNEKLVMNLALLGLLVLMLLPWSFEAELSINLPKLHNSQFYLILGLMAVMDIMVIFADMNRKPLKLAGYVLLVMIMSLLITDMVIFINAANVQSQLQRPFVLTPVPFLAGIYMAALIAVYSQIFRTAGTAESARFQQTDRKDDRNLVLFGLAVVNVVLVTMMPADNNGVSYTSFLFAFVEREPVWGGNYPTPDLYHGMILTLGYVSLLYLPVLALLSKFRSRIIFILTNISLIHVFACTVSFPLRFNRTGPEMFNGEFALLCALPAVILFLLYYLFFNETFLEGKKGKYDEFDCLLQVIYLIVAIGVFSHLFMVGSATIKNGKWYLICSLIVLAAATGVYFFRSKRKNGE